MNVKLIITFIDVIIRRSSSKFRYHFLNYSYITPANFALRRDTIYNDSQRKQLTLGRRDTDSANVLRGSNYRIERRTIGTATALNLTLLTSCHKRRVSRRRQLAREKNSSTHVFSLFPHIFQSSLRRVPRTRKYNANAASVVVQWIRQKSDRRAVDMKSKRRPHASGDGNRK